MAYVLCTIATCVLIGISESYVYTDIRKGGIRILNIYDGASVMTATFVPSLVLHIFLFMLKVYLLATVPAYMRTDTVFWRFIKEYVLIHRLNVTCSLLNYTEV